MVCSGLYLSNIFVTSRTSTVNSSTVRNDSSETIHSICYVVESTSHITIITNFESITIVLRIHIPKVTTSLVMDSSSSTATFVNKDYSFASRDHDDDQNLKCCECIHYVWKFRFLIPRFESQSIGPPGVQRGIYTLSYTSQIHSPNSQHHDGSSKQQQP
jgi:hypothetical protein